LAPYFSRESACESLFQQFQQKQMFGVNKSYPATTKSYGRSRRSRYQHPHRSGDFKLLLQVLDFIA
jgi:hypothetical protein